MLRRLILATLVVVALASLAQESHAGCKRCCKKNVVCNLFGNYGPGPFGCGDFAYAGYYPRANYTCCGCRIQ
jgi:hypothetical protein